MTDGSRSVSDPVVAFAGPANLPIVAWTQNTLPPQASSPLIGDLGEALQRQEIYVATWDGAAWHTPVALTSDTVGDGRPAIAGDKQGATLAWTCETDGDLVTHSDQRIAVREMGPPLRRGRRGMELDAVARGRGYGRYERGSEPCPSLHRRSGQWVAVGAPHPDLIFRR